MRWPSRSELFGDSQKSSYHTMATNDRDRACVGQRCFVVLLAAYLESTFDPCPIRNGYIAALAFRFGNG